MSEFSVHRTADTIPALKYCLILDGERIAGGKPDYRGNNHLISWSTRETYGPVDQLKVENAKLRELIVAYDSALRRMCDQMQRYVDCHDCILGKDYGDDSCAIDELREAACVMGVEL